MADEDEITVTIEPEVGVADTDVKVETETDPVADLKGQYKTLEANAERDRQARHTAEAARGAAEQRAANAERVAHEARGQVVESQYDTVVSGLSAAQAEADAAEREYKAAYDAGDGAAMATAQRKIARAEAKTVQFDEAKSAIEARVKRDPERREAPIEAPQRQVPSDPVEAYVQGRTEPTARWLRDHKEFITDPRKNAKLTAAHHDAVADGLSPDTDAYFEHVEKFVGLRKVEVTKTNGAKKTGGPVVAPVSASPGGTNGGGATVNLTQGEARSATDGTLVWNYNDPSGKNRFKKGDPIGHQEMARRKADGMKRGLYDRTYTDS